MKFDQKGLGNGGVQRFAYQRLQHSFDSEEEINMDSSDKDAMHQLEKIGQNLFYDNMQPIMQTFFAKQKQPYQPMQTL